MKSLSLRSPAKLNLYLKVQRKRPDGFHDIETVFERINLFDDIKFSLNHSGRISILCNHPQVPLGRKNLVFKVAELLRNDFNIKEGVDIDINKRIPVAAGLAGGSSNAATALLGLNKLWKLQLTSKQLLDYARKIGSDVAFFLYDCSWAKGTGRGDQIKKLSIGTKLWQVIVTPKIKMYSGAVYQNLNLSPTKSLTKINDDVTILSHHIRKSDFDGVVSLMKNDLERSIFALCPKLLKLKEKLKALHTQGVMVSGSGPSVFALVRSRSEAIEISARLAKQYSQIFVVSTL